MHDFVVDVETFGLRYASLKSSRARMRRSLLEASWANGRSCLRVTVLVAVPVRVPVGVSN